MSKCSLCGKETIDRPHEELKAEYDERVKPLAGDLPEDPEDIDIVCTACYEACLAWTATKSPQEIEEMKRDYYDHKTPEGERIMNKLREMEQPE